MSDNYSADQKVDKKKLLNLRLQTIFLGGLLVIFFIIVVVLLIGFNGVKKYAGMIEQEIKAIDMDGINKTVTDVNATVNNANDVVSSIDMNSINDAVKSLNDTVNSIDMKASTKIPRITYIPTD